MTAAWNNAFVFKFALFKVADLVRVEISTNVNTLISLGSWLELVPCVTLPLARGSVCMRSGTCRWLQKQSVQVLHISAPTKAHRRLQFPVFSII